MSDSRRLILLVAALAVAVVAGVPAALGTALTERKQRIDNRISGLRDRIDEAKHKEGVLTDQIQAAGARIRQLEGEIAPLNAKVARLEQELAGHRAKLEQLREIYRYQTERLQLLVRQHDEAQRRLERRLVELYETEQPDEVAIFFQAESLNDLIEQIQLFNDIGRQDRRIADEIRHVKGEMRLARQKTAETKAHVAAATAALAEKTAAERAARDTLLARESALRSARSSRRTLLANVREDRHEAEEDLQGMLAASAAIASKIQAAQAAAQAAASSQPAPQPSSGSQTTSQPSSSGFIWPVQGVLTSGFGMRWGRMHEGIDIAAPIGTPIHAAAAGTIIYAGWMGGYGNLVIIDHGGGMATAYGHQSAIYVTGGSVSQGQVIGAVGSTGNSTGPHLHFEVRVNGSAVDPLGYL